MCTAVDVRGDWLSFLPREQSMPEAGDGNGCEPLDVRLQSGLPEVCDERSCGDLADGVGHRDYSC